VDIEGWRDEMAPCGYLGDARPPRQRADRRKSIKRIEEKHTVPSKKSNCRLEIIGCALTGGLGILLLDLLLFKFNVYYFSDDVNVLYPVAVHSLTGKKGNPTRPFEYLIVLAANKIYLPLWLGASLVCVVGATILSALACEKLFERRLSKAGWWVLGIANPLLFYVVSQPDVVSQALSDLLFAAAILAFVSEMDRPPDQPLGSWRADKTASFLNLTAAALFFTKETAVAAPIVIPAATALIRLKTRRLSRIFLLSLLLPIAAGICWILLKLEFPFILPTDEGRDRLKLEPIIWLENFVTNFAYPVTPLPSSFLEFERLRQLWVMTAIGSFLLFLCLIIRASSRHPRLVVLLLVIACSCAPTILIHSSELYPTMIAPFAVSMVLLIRDARMRWLGLSYGLMLYAASLGNSIIYCLGSDFNLLGLRHLNYSIYGKGYQFYPICPIGTTAHVGWDGAAAGELPYGPPVRGKITCIR
jgi:hypothetical protein